MQLYRELPHVLAAFYGYLACHAYAVEISSAAMDYIGNPRGQFFLRRKVMTEEFGASERSIDGYINSLIGRGFLQRRHRFRNGSQRPSHFRLRLDLDEEFPAGEFTRMCETSREFRENPTGVAQDLAGGVAQEVAPHSKNRVPREQGSFSTSALPSVDVGNTGNAGQSVPSSTRLDKNTRKKLSAVSDRFSRGWDLDYRTDLIRLPDRWQANRAHWRLLHNAWDRGIHVEAEAAFAAFDEWVGLGTWNGTDKKSRSWGAMLTEALRVIIADLADEDLDDADPFGEPSHRWAFEGTQYDPDGLVTMYHRHTRMAA